MVFSKDSLLILPFDHRSSLLKKLFGVEGRQPTDEEKQKFSALKEIVYDAFKLSLQNGVPKQHAGVLVDEEFGSKILQDAKKNGIITAMPLEKSGQNEFDFEHTNYAEHVNSVQPTYLKVLVRYNPEDGKELNFRQLERLKSLQDYVSGNSKKLIFELLVPGTSQQLQKFPNNPAEYDLSLRPELMVKAMDEIQKFGISPNVWKLEGVSKPEQSKALVKQANSNNCNAGIITLGRGEDAEKVKEWIKVGARIPGIIDFAIGRTVFWEGIKNFNDGKISRQQAVQQISDNYKSFVDIWVKEKGN